MPLPTTVVGGNVIASLWGNAVVASLPQVGFMSMWVGDTAPSDYLLCRGQAVSRTTYASLWAMCQSPAGSGVGRFGNGDGSTTFNLPDMRGRYGIGHNPGGSYFTVGVGERFGNKDAVVPAHQHVVPNHLHPINVWSGYVNIDHQHAMTQLEGPSGGAEPAFGYSRINDWTAGGATGYAATHPMNQNQNVRVPINGATDGSGDFWSYIAGSDGTNANLPPSLSLNFIVRAL